MLQATDQRRGAMSDPVPLVFRAAQSKWWQRAEKLLGFEPGAAALKDGLLHEWQRNVTSRMKMRTFVVLGARWFCRRSSPLTPSLRRRYVSLPRRHVASPRRQLRCHRRQVSLSSLPVVTRRQTCRHRVVRCHHHRRTLPSWAGNTIGSPA